jgi:hypothetical protein
MLTIRDAQLHAFQQSINARTVMPRLRERFAAMGLLRAGDRAADARVLADVREAQALGLATEPELAQYASYGFTFPAWQSRPELAAILARPGLDPDERLTLLHETLSAL